MNFTGLAFSNILLCPMGENTLGWQSLTIGIESITALDSLSLKVPG
ncbi:hypothetical protein AVDCRST_MAG81-888 [uncultured Synechococcales cyanobacterium]|uniref:Uncharacterized protein n=1 Tax=uncultured Synechococcales cyanobacterium TaxID=1936017 RepID=A0A6J4V0N7_9CYAN|nr:hypothetical protein AVDCRST_MAG81-888 [uncultured Synechococcales cyanobacterium]